MTINIECMKKSLKTDYRNIGIITVICIIIIGIVWALINLSDQIKAILAIIAQPFTAVNVFIRWCKKTPVFRQGMNCALLHLTTTLK